MSLAVNGLLAVLGWTGLVLLSYAPGPLPTVALIVALAVLVGSIASLLLALGWYGVLRGLVSRERVAPARGERPGRPPRP
jgi:hypothetical protein